MDQSPKDAGQEEYYGRLICGAVGRSFGVCGSMWCADGNACYATTGEYAQANRCLEKLRQVLNSEREVTDDDRYTRTIGVEVDMQGWLRRYRRWRRRSGYAGGGLDGMVGIDVGSGGVVRGRLNDGTEGTDVEVPPVPQRWVRHAQMQLSFVRSAVVSSTCVDGNL